MIFEEREGFEINIDPRVKIVSLIYFFLICLLPSRLISALSLFLFSLLITFLSKAFRNIWRARFLIITVFFLTVILWIISNGIGYLDKALTIAFKLCSMIMGGITFISITKQEELFFGLRKFFIPYRFSFVISLAMRFIPVILNLVNTVVQAQKTRGYRIEGINPFAKIKKSVPLIGPVLLYVLRWTDKLSIALESRGFSSSERVDYYYWKFDFKNFIIFSLLTFIFILFILLRIRNLV